jgi:AraC-like DNA-binding protein
MVISGVMESRVGCYHRPEANLGTGAIIGAGRVVRKAGTCRDRTLTCYAVIYLDGGAGWFSDATTPRCEIGPGTAVLLRPGIAHGYGPHPNRTWNEWWIMMQGSLFDHLIGSGVFSHQHPIWHPGVHPELIAGFQQILDERQAWASDAKHLVAAQAAEAELAARTLMLMHRLVRFDQQRAPAPPSWLADCLTTLDADLARPVDLRALATRSGLSYERFRKVFTQLMGVPPARYRASRRIDQAKHLLMGGTSIAEVTEQLGYCDVFFFGRQFKQFTGMTPGRFQGR